MTSVFDWETIVGPILLEHDILGAKGCAWPVQRSSILVSIDERLLDEQSLFLRASQFFPEGFGFAEFPREHLNIPKDAKGNDLKIEWQSQQAIPCGSDLVFLRNIIEPDLGHTDFIFDEQSFWVPLRKSSTTKIRLLEMFAGGFGGWHRASQFLQGLSPLRFQTVGLEIDLNIAATYAISHSACLLKSLQDAPRTVLANSQDNWIIVTDVSSHEWQPIVGEFSPDIVAISAPCKPWSGASSSPGLFRSDGVLLISAILACRWFRPKCIMLEQVSAFATHPHKTWVVKTLMHIGYVVSWQKVIELSDQSPTKRARWLAVATRVNAACTPQSAPAWFVMENCTPRTVGAVINWADSEFQLLEPSDEILAVAKDPKFFKGAKFFKGFDVGKQILQQRTYHVEQKIPTFMALYGSQHGLNTEYLEKYGYFGHFVMDPCRHDKIRFWHPAEVALMHGITSPILIQEVLPFSWLIIGNSIAEQHALLVLIDVCQRITGERFSPFVVFHEYQKARFRTWEIKLHHIDHDFLILSAKHPCVPEEFDEHVRNLRAAVQRSERFAFWSSTQGCVSTWLDFVPVRDVPQESQISEVSPNDFEVSPTVTFGATTTIPICLSEHEGKHGFIANGSVPWESIESIWHSCLKKTDDQEGTIFRNFPDVKMLQSFSPWADGILLVFCVEGMHILQRERAMNSPSQEPVFVRTRFDLFGTVFEYSFAHSTPVVLTQKFDHSKLLTDLAFVQAAYHFGYVTFDWQPATDKLSIRAFGETSAVKVIVAFWKNIFSSTVLEGIGRHLVIDEHSVAFAIASYSALPPLPTLELLAILATRALLDGIPLGKQTSKVVAIKWRGGLLWHGSLPDDMTIGTLLSLLQIGLEPTVGSMPLRIVSKGSRLAHEAQVQSIPDHRTLPYPVMHVAGELVGGGPSKSQSRTVVKNAIAGVLLEQGHDLNWVSTTVEQLIARAGLTHLQHIIGTPNNASKVTAIGALCKEHGIKIPDQPKPTSKTSLDGAPWNKPKKSKHGKELDPTEFKITPGFFVNDDDTPVNQILQLRAQTTGICLMNHQQVQPWLRGNQTISSDELSAFVLGQGLLDTTLKVSNHTIPCTNADGDSVLLAGQLIQFGSKHMKLSPTTLPQLTNEERQLCALTVYKSDWTNEQWIEATNASHKFIKRILADDGFEQAVLAMWGRSMRQGKSPSSPAQCTSIQVHCTISKAKLDKLLVVSGYNKLYITPKELNGRLDLSFKVLWVPGNLMEVQASSATLKGCLGLVKGQKTFGLRFRGDTFADAWKQLYPGSNPPEKAVGDLLFKAEGFPYGCTADTLSQWSAAIKWTFAPVKALGPRAWLLRAETQPAKDVEMFNTSPILIRFLPPKAIGDAPILLGPRSKGHDRDAPASAASGSTDPWANWTGPRLVPSNPAPRTVDGPIEAKFAAQEEKITALRNDLKALTDKHDQSTANIHQQFQQVEQREQQNLKQIESTMIGIQRDLQQSLSQALTTNAQAMDNRMQELKALFMKRKSSEVEDENEAM